MPSAQIIQMVAAYENGQLPIDLIADEFETDELTVKAALLNHSLKYRGEVKADIKKGIEPDFTDTDLEMANNVIRQTVLETDDENLKFRAAKYIRDDKKGRKDILSGLGALHINVFEFNEQLRRQRIAREMRQETKQLNNTQPSESPGPAQIIDSPSRSNTVTQSNAPVMEAELVEDAA